MNITIKSLFAAVLLAAACQPNSARAGTIYHLTGLTLGGKESRAYGINAAGQVVGFTADASGNFDAFLYSGGVMTNLGTLVGGPGDSIAYGINDAGQVVGFSDASNYDHAFVYSGGVTTDLTAATKGVFTSAAAINASGQIAGTDSAGDAAVYSGGVVTDLRLLPEGTSSDAYGINAAGEIVGQAFTTTAPGGPHAFVYSNGVMADLGTLPSDLYSNATAINAAGQIVGYSGVQPVGDGHAFLYSDGIMSDLGTLNNLFDSEALGINDAGVVVGESDDGSTYNAFVYSGGVMTNLNSVLDNSGNGWTLMRAYAINDNGWIAGYGTNPAGEREAFLLTPTPEPSTWLLATLGAGGLWFARRRRAAVRVVE